MAWYSKMVFSKLALPFRAQRTVRNVGMTPLQALQNKVDQGVLRPDPHQKKLMEALTQLHQTLHEFNASTSSGISRLFSAKTIPRGLYIYGSVGSGKTTCMDMFYNCCEMITRKQRVHFNAFMNNVHKTIHEVKNTNTSNLDATKPVADMIAEQSFLICFDEFQVTDIADAMILKSLFTHLFNAGIVMVATSNRMPRDLYKHGLQRSQFKPFIGVLQQHCNVIPLESGIDYRRLAQEVDGRYFLKSSGDADRHMKTTFKLLCTQENDTIRPRTITHFGRDLTFARVCGQVLDSNFTELCERPLGGNDYVQIAQYFHTILIRDVPQLTMAMRPQARRFIILIDTLYNNRVRLIMSADVPIDRLFNLTGGPSRKAADDQRVLMDDLNIEQGSKASKTSVFTGEEEVFALDRTVSRLHEMQTNQYWESWKKH